MVLAAWRKENAPRSRVFVAPAGDLAAILLDGSVGVFELPQPSNRRQSSVGGGGVPGSGPSIRAGARSLSALVPSTTARLRSSWLGAGSGAGLAASAVPRVAPWDCFAISLTQLPVPECAATSRCLAWSRDGALMAVTLPADPEQGTPALDRIAVLDGAWGWRIVGTLTLADFGVGGSPGVPARIAGLGFRRPGGGSGGAQPPTAPGPQELVVCWHDGTVRRVSVEVGLKGVRGHRVGLRVCVCGSMEPLPGPPSSGPPFPLSPPPRPRPSRPCCPPMIPMPLVTTLPSVLPGRAGVDRPVTPPDAWGWPSVHDQPRLQFPGALRPVEPGVQLYHCHRVLSG
jgi:hypothetical protein